MKALYGFLLTSFTLFLILNNHSKAYAGDLQTDSLALVALYDSTDGDNWTNNTGWKTDSLSAWFGIDVKNGRVASINLQNNNLNGPVPASLGNLSALGFLALSNNKLTGNIPSELGNAAYIGELYLNGNSLTGSIPATLGNLSRLAFLYLGYNNLEGSIPPELHKLKDLVTLSLPGNLLTGGIPEHIDSLTNLRTLILAGNPLGGTIPPELGNISGLQHLYLDGCQLTGSIPSEITSLTGLRTLSLSTNELTDSLSPQISSLSELNVLNVSRNQFTGNIPPELGNLTGLQFLSLQFNNFTGIIPPELGNLTELTDLGLHNNQLTGTIPPELGNLSNLTQLFVNNNDLNGPVPQELTNLTQLKYLYLNNNKLEKLPDFSGLTLISEFYIQNNRFTFGDMEPNIHILNSYFPQDSLGKPDTMFFSIEDTLFLHAMTDGLYNKYQWTFNGTDIGDDDLYSGSNDSVLKIMNPAITDTGVFSCRVTNDTVTGITMYRYPVYLLPAVKIIVMPEGTRCAGASLEVGYKSVEVSPGNVFTLELSDSLGNFNEPVVIGSLTGTDSIGTIEASVPGNISSGDRYRLRINASNPLIKGIPGTGTIRILNRTLSDPVLMPSGNSGFCAGESLEISTDSLSDLDYIWYKDETVIQGASAYKYIVTEEGTYYVRITDACNSDSLSSNTINISEYPVPVIDLSLDGTMLAATQNTNYTYAWFMNGNNLMLDNNQYQYTASENGEYYVEVTDENGCYNISNIQTVNSITALKNFQTAISVFPNPVNDKFYISFTGDIFPERLTLTDLSGKIIYDLQPTGNFIDLDVSCQSGSIYILHIETVEGTVILKLVKR